jgi:protein-tyrosine kinase
MNPFKDNRSMIDTSPPSLTRVHVVEPLRSDEARSERPEPLRIEYSTTRVLPSAQARLLRTVGIVKADRSALSESFKMLRSQVVQRMREDGHRLIAVTSPRGMRGKSMTAVNLALTMAADLDTAIVLVDADLGGRAVQRLFGLDDEPGLIEHLTQGAAIPDLLINPGIERFVLLPAGRAEVSNSSELLATKALQHLMQEMKQRYHDRTIVVDLPPLLDTADALAFLPQVDTTLVVIEANTTSIRDIESATKLLAPFNLIGTVLSQAPTDDPDKPCPWYRRWRRRGADPWWVDTVRKS